MSYLTKGTCLAAWIALLGLPLGAHYGCGGDEETGECGAGQAMCSGACVNTMTDASHCGACGNACGSGESCATGSCACPAGRTPCPDGCVLTLSDSSNCGTCGNQCGEIQTCINGSCQCPGGQTLCGAACADTTADKLNCGSCDHPCAAAQSCVASQCACQGGKQLCGEECVDTNTNSSFCGDCSTACDPGEYCNVGNCDSISNCPAVPMDSYEANDTCETAKVLPEAPEVPIEDPPVTVGDATLHHTDQTVDTDWYTVYAHEATHICVPLTQQCSFFFDIAFTPPEGADHAVYELCVSVGTCGAFDSEFCTTETDWDAQAGHYAMLLSWQGTCGTSDSWTFYLKVARNGGEENCSQYGLDYKFYYADETCP